MSNTGLKIVLTLKEIVSGSGIPTGETKPDSPSDPDYIAPYTDTGACPISYSTACPIVAGTGGTGNIEFEFSLPNAVVNNPGITKVNVLVMSQSSVDGTLSFILPNSSPNYFSGSFTGLSATSYSLSVQYYTGSTFIKSCSISGLYGVS